jgi:DNA-binding transcriptional MocR family regulator
VLDQLIVAELLGRIETIAEGRRALLRERRAVLAEALRHECPGWEFDIPPGGLSLWVRLPGTSSTALAAAAGRHGVDIVAGTAFGVDGVLDDHVRVPYVLPPERLREAVSRLALARHDADTVPLARPAYV